MDRNDFSGALTVSGFCQTYNIGRTSTYEEIKQGRLSAVKAGAKTLILKSEADRWAHSLPKLNTAKASEVSV